MGYQPFLVAPYESGISTYLKPWLTSTEAMTEMQDCYTNRGHIQKRYGYELYDNFPNGVGVFFLATSNGASTGPYTGNLPYTPVGKLSVIVTHTLAGVTNTATDNGAGVIAGTNVALGSTINYVSGAISITFTTAPDKNTEIRVNFAVKVGVGSGTTTPTVSIPITGAFASPIATRSLKISDPGSAQTTANTDVPNDPPTTGDLAGNQATAGTIDYATGVVTGLTFAAPTSAGGDIYATWNFQAPSNPIKGIEFFWTASSSQQTLVFNNNQVALFTPNTFNLTNISGGNIFNTSFSAFFSTTNYLGKMIILNNTDRMTFWDGTNFTQPIISFTNATPTVNELTTGLHVVLYKNRLIVLRPTETGVVKPQRARYSALNSNTDWVSDVQKRGGFIDAPTPEWIIGYAFIQDVLVVHFQFSTWRLRYTGNDLDPFRWQLINTTRRVDTPYGTVEHQRFDTTLGSTGLLKCDGLNIERYDEKIIDFSQDDIDQESLDLINGYRFDQINQQLLCYPSDPPTPNTSYLYCNKWLVWNFLEDSFAIFNIPSTTFGTYIQTQDLAWQDLTASNGFVHPGSNPPTDIEWGDLMGDENWLAYFSGTGAQVPVFGTETGQVMQLFPFYSTDNGTRSGFTFTTVDFNPFVKTGQRCRFGYVDFYFDRPDAPNDPDLSYELSIDFYDNESPTPFLTTILDPSEDNFSKKRVYVNRTAQFHRFRIYLSDDQIQNSSVATAGFVLNGFILYMSPTGRLVGP